MDMFGPRRSYSIETNPLAMLLIIMAMVNGDTARRTPVEQPPAFLFHAFETRRSRCRPSRRSLSWSTAFRSIPESAKAVFAAAIANCANRSARRASLGDLKYLAGSNPAHLSGDFAVVIRQSRTTL